MAAKKLKAALGYTMAAAAFIVVIVTFVGNDALSRIFARATGITVSPRYSGGEVIKTIDHDTYKSLIHRPVFDGLFSDRADGFIQVTWYGQPPWPRKIEEAVDCDSDGTVDFTVTLDTQNLTADLSMRNPSVTGIEQTYRLDRGFAVRISLHKNSTGKPSK